MSYVRNKLIRRPILSNFLNSTCSVIFVEQKTENFEQMSTKYIWNNYGIATPPRPELLTFPCVTQNISWLISQKMWQPVMLKVRFIPYTKVQ